jgi:hypothetical protein
MKRIIDYTLAWDSSNKLGYFTAIDEQNQSHVFSKLCLGEFEILLGLLKENRVYIDNNKWIVTGWRPENTV